MKEEKSGAWKRINADTPVGRAPSSNIACKDCVFRLRSNHGYDYLCYANGYCEIYTHEISNGKPHEVLFENAKCEYYMKDEEIEN